MNKVITMSNRDYFKYGDLFIQTRNRVNADFILYGPDLTEKQQNTLRKNNIQYKKIPQKDFDTKMQFLKFKLMLDEMEEGVDGISMIDFDTFFLKDWGDIFNNNFDLGVTVRNEYIKKKILRAYANGGVIFSRNTEGGKKICEYALKVMENGGDKNLPEYDKIFKTLEEGRPKHKTHKRETLRWWVDQVFLSSLIIRYFIKTARDRTRGSRIKENTFYSFNNFNVGLFDCDKYNVLDTKPSKNSFIVHLKNKGREDLEKYRSYV